ncbi:hypothetical protein [Pseudomonas sp. NPDC096950]|uniref:hypothetical protein n=1 Tax=Pseudomonas sp. NPDC096950 TaxID=3364485 RepID=UPI00383A78B6
MTRNFALALAAPLLTLSIGVGIGYALNQQEPPTQSEVTPPFTVKSAGKQWLREICGRSDAYASLTKGDRQTLKVLRLDGLEAIAFSDRGVACLVEGSLRTRVEHGSGASTTSDEQIHQFILVSITGESELVSEEFFKATLKSRAISAMASNVGNDGTVTPKIELKPLSR